MEIEDNAEKWPRNQFKKGKPPGPGRTKGALNKRTYAKIALSLIAKWPDNAYKVLTGMFPDLPREMNTEMMLYIAQVDKAIRGQDTQAAKFLTDQVYGKNPMDGEDGAVLEGAEKIVIVYKKEYLESDPLD